MGVLRLMAAILYNAIMLGIKDGKWGALIGIIIFILLVLIFV